MLRPVQTGLMHPIGTVRMTIGRGPMTTGPDETTIGRGQTVTGSSGRTTIGTGQMTAVPGRTTIGTGQMTTGPDQMTIGRDPMTTGRDPMTIGPRQTTTGTSQTHLSAQIRRIHPKRRTGLIISLHLVLLHRPGRMFTRRLFAGTNFLSGVEPVCRPFITNRLSDNKHTDLVG